jgi:hypothetical protein
VTFPNPPRLISQLLKPKNGWRRSLYKEHRGTNLVKSGRIDRGTLGIYVKPYLNKHRPLYPPDTLSQRLIAGTSYGQTLQGERHLEGGHLWLCHHPFPDSTCTFSHVPIRISSLLLLVSHSCDPQDPLVSAYTYLSCSFFASRRSLTK